MAGDGGSDGTHETGVGLRPVTSLASRRARLMPHHLFGKGATVVEPPNMLPAVVDVDVSQSISQRARGVFSVRVHLQRPDRVEVVSVDDIPDGRPGQGVTTVAEGSHTPRHARPGLSGVETAMETAALAKAAGRGAGQIDAMDALRKLGELRGAGIITEAEFIAAKAEVLRRL
jgi:hypothetical protein